MNLLRPRGGGRAAAPLYLSELHKGLNVRFQIPRVCQGSHNNHLLLLLGVDGARRVHLPNNFANDLEKRGRGGGLVKRSGQRLSRGIRRRGRGPLSFGAKKRPFSAVIYGECRWSLSWGAWLAGSVNPASASTLPRPPLSHCVPWNGWKLALTFVPRQCLTSDRDNLFYLYVSLCSFIHNGR